MTFSLKSIEHFQSIAEKGSVTAASRHLGVGQATLTESLQRLEEQLGVPLFQRQARGMSLTPHGERFARHADRILSAVADAEESMARSPDRLQGSLTIGVTNPLTAHFLPGLLERFRRQYPLVQVQVLEDSAQYIEHQLVNGEVDVALLMMPPRQRNEPPAVGQPWEMELLLESPWCLWVGAGHPLALKSWTSIAQWRHEPVVILRNHELEKAAGDWWRRMGIRPRTVVRTWATEAVRHFVAVGLGVALLPEFLFRPWTEDGGRLHRVHLEDAIDPLRIGIAWRRGTTGRDIAQSFVELARTAAVKGG